MCPHRWLTPVTGRPQDALRPSATPTPTRRQPARPGPRVTAMRPTSSGPACVCSKARSRRCGSRSRWSRAASSGTTPPNSLCRSTCEWMTLASTRRPPSTSATDVSSQLVSIPSVTASSFTPTRASPDLPTSWGGELAFVLGQQVAAKPADVGFDALEVGLVRAPESRRVDRVRPHHDRVLVGRPHLERHPLRAHVVGGLDQSGEDDATVAAVVKIAPDANGRHVCLVVHAPHAPVADDGRVKVGTQTRRPLDDAFLSQHHVMRARTRSQLAVVGIARPRGGEDVALDLLHRRDIRLAHQLERQLLADLDHQATITECERKWTACTRA